MINIKTKRFKLVAEYNGSITSVSLDARCKHTAIAVAASVIKANYASDKRFMLGKITLFNHDDVPFYVIPMDGCGEGGFIEEKE